MICDADGEECHSSHCAMRGCVASPTERERVSKRVMDSYPSRQEFHNAIVVFEKSAKTIDDYIRYTIAASKALNQGTGMSGAHICDTIEAALKEVRE